MAIDENKNREIEVRFLKIDVDQMKKRLFELGAKDLGEDLFQEIVFYDSELKWRELGKFVRLRRTNKGVLLSYKHHQTRTAEGTVEIELKVDSMEKARELLVSLGFVAFREQEKKRHSFLLGEVIADIDTWPKVPTYVELEGPSEAALKEAAGKLGLDWSKAFYGGAHVAIEEVYKIPVRQLRYFKFDRME